MPSFCSVVDCGMRAERDAVSFFRFPAVLSNKGDFLKSLSIERRTAWINSLKRGPLSETQVKNGRICSRHFIMGRPASLDDKSNPDWIPSRNMGYISSKHPSQSAIGRYQRFVTRRRQNLVVEPRTARLMPKSDHETDDCSLHEISSAAVHKNGASVSVQTDLTVEELCSAFNELVQCNSKIYSLKTKLDSLELNEDSFKDNDSKTCYFTGFPKAEMLFVMHKTVVDYLSSHPNKALSTFQQFLLTLMKLRLNLPFKYLAYRFGVCPTTASESFYRCIDVLYDRLKNFVLWLNREALQKNVPACFRETFGNRVAVVIDCFEVFTETPSNVVNASRCWSNYKHHETVKFLIGITPQGTISYISEAWGGRTSDKFLTENCGFLKLLLPGDVVLADRGFLIHDSVQTLGANLKIPAFTKGKTQLHPTDVESTRSIATVRIHVERVIGLLKRKYQIFHETIPVSMLSNARDSLGALDKTVVICSALLNLCPPQIPLN